MSEEYDLGKSSKKLGKLYPILKDKEGNIIDGFHRQNADPDWPTLTVDSVDTPVKLELARLASNFCRRQLPASEFQNRIAFLVKSGMKVSEIAEQTGISETTIRKYEPQELKDQTKVEAARSATHAIQTVETQETIAECAYCHVHTNVKPWKINGGQTFLLCDRDYREAMLNPEHMQGKFRTLERTKQILAKKKVSDDQLGNLIACGHCGRTIGIMNAKNFENADGKSIDLCPSCFDKAVHSKEDRSARMHPKVGRFEDDVAEDFSAHGIPLGMAGPNNFVTIPFPISDRTWELPKGVLVFRLNGKKAHEKRGDKDDAIYRALETLGVRVLSYTYENKTEAEKKEIRELVSEKLKELGWTKP